MLGVLRNYFAPVAMDAARQDVAHFLHFCEKAHAMDEYLVKCDPLRRESEARMKHGASSRFLRDCVLRTESQPVLPRHAHSPCQDSWKFGDEPQCVCSLHPRVPQADKVFGLLTARARTHRPGRSSSTTNRAWRIGKPRNSLGRAQIGVRRNRLSSPTQARVIAATCVAVNTIFSRSTSCVDGIPLVPTHCKGADASSRAELVYHESRMAHRKVKKQFGEGPNRGEAK